MNKFIHAAMLIAADGSGIGSGRLLPTVAAVVGLIGVVVGGLHAANAAGGFGTGNGLAGAIVAMVLGLISIVLGGLALARSQRREGTEAERG